ncbi:MAG: hypothetical protein ACXVB9_01860 [Bdellovibrionota bacterium]
MTIRNALALAALCSASTPAFADKIMNPGEFYTAVNAGEKIVCTGSAAPVLQPQSFMANGSTVMSADEMRDASACTGQADSSTGAELRAKGIAESNGRTIQCPQSYTCALQDGAMQYRRRDNICIAYMPFLATPR